MYHHPKLMKAENLLVWWADTIGRNEQVNGYASESSLESFTSGGSGIFKSKPIYKGDINRDTCKTVDILLKEKLTPDEYDQTFWCFFPNITQYEREQSAECAARTLRARKAGAINIIIDNWSVIYPPKKVTHQKVGYE